MLEIITLISLRSSLFFIIKLSLLLFEDDVLDLGAGDIEDNEKSEVDEESGWEVEVSISDLVEDLSLVGEFVLWVLKEEGNATNDQVSTDEGGDVDLDYVLSLLI